MITYRVSNDIFIEPELFESGATDNGAMVFFKKYV